MMKKIAVVAPRQRAFDQYVRNIYENTDGDKSIQFLGRKIVIEDSNGEAAYFHVGSIEDVRGREFNAYTLLYFAYDVPDFGAIVDRFESRGVVQQQPSTQ